MNVESFSQKVRVVYENSKELEYIFYVITQEWIDDIVKKVERYDIPEDIFKVNNKEGEKVASIKLARSELTIKLDRDVIEVLFNGKNIEELKFNRFDSQVIRKNGERLEYEDFEYWLDQFGI